jgi:hypothetical protein
MKTKQFLKRFALAPCIPAILLIIGFSAPAVRADTTSLCSASGSETLTSPGEAYASWTGSPGTGATSGTITATPVIGGGGTETAVLETGPGLASATSTLGGTGQTASTYCFEITGPDSSTVTYDFAATATATSTGFSIAYAGVIDDGQASYVAYSNTSPDAIPETTVNTFTVDLSPAGTYFDTVSLVANVDGENGSASALADPDITIAPGQLNFADYSVLVNAGVPNGSPAPPVGAPEPASLLLPATGLIGLGGAAKLKFFLQT